VPQSAVRHLETIIVFSIGMEMGLPIDSAALGARYSADIFLRQILMGRYKATTESAGTPSPRYSIPERDAISGRALPIMLALIFFVHSPGRLDSSARGIGYRCHHDIHPRPIRSRRRPCSAFCWESLGRCSFGRRTTSTRRCRRIATNSVDATVGLGVVGLNRRERGSIRCPLSAAVRRNSPLDAMGRSSR
jgi:hypothetical protein